MAKQRVQQRADAVVTNGLLVGFFDLSSNLSFADDHAVKAGGDAEQMAHRLGLPVNVQMRTNGRGRQIVEVGKEFRDVLGVHFPRGLRPMEDAADIKLDAVTSAEDQSLAVETCAQLRMSAGQLFIVEGEAFAHIDRGGLVAASDGVKDHRLPPCPGQWGNTRQPTSSTNVKIVSTATGRPRRW